MSEQELVPAESLVNLSLKLEGFDLQAKYPEYGNDDLRQAYLTGWADALRARRAPERPATAPRGAEAGEGS